jgi:hypothetical protein
LAAIRAIFGWLGRNAILYAALVLAILASPFVVAEWSKPNRHLHEAAQLEAVKARLATSAGDAERRLSRAAEAAQRKSAVELDLAIVEAGRARTEAQGRRRSAAAKALSLARGDADALFEDGRLELEIQYRDREIAGLTAARERLAKRERLNALPADLDARLARARAIAAEGLAACQASTQARKDFEGRWAVVVTLERYGQQRLSALRRTERDACKRSTDASHELRTTADLVTLKANAERAYLQSRAWTDGRILAATTELDQKIAAERAAAAGSWRQKLSLWAERTHLPKVLLQAAAALVLIMASPFLIRLFCYFVLAPIAMQRPQIRIGGLQGAAAAIPPAERSTTSVAVKLAAGEALLVRHGYLQTTSETGAKSTQWLLDWRHPVTSVATGLTFLTRIQGEGEVTTVSAVGDPFAEVTTVTLPDGAACVLQPRALAAVVQPIGRRLRVTSHWRLLSLNAWLTLQLRYFVFHGPARLVLKGGRGIRIERAERGRILGQDQVVGFSTDLAYSVTRNETFWPYLLGREPLLRDRVAAGDGVLIVEEAPMAGRAGKARRGIEGMVDAGMKVFGW